MMMSEVSVLQFHDFRKRMEEMTLQPCIQSDYSGIVRIYE